jgi:glutathione peroxidase
MVEDSPRGPGILPRRVRWVGREVLMQEAIMTIHEIPVRTLDGREMTLGEYAGKTLLVVNVASKCGLTPQYEGLTALHAELAPRGFAVLGFPCNQFGGQEPGGPEEITACAMGYGADFPLFEKIEVNGENRHPLYERLTEVPDDEDKAGDVQWNFEKFLISPQGEIVGRFRPLVGPDDPELRVAIEQRLEPGGRLTQRADEHVDR